MYYRKAIIAGMEFEQSAARLKDLLDHEPQIDQALLDAASIGLLAERLGVPLLPWQQQFVDRSQIALALTPRATET